MELARKIHKIHENNDRLKNSQNQHTCPSAIKELEETNKKHYRIIIWGRDLEKKTSNSLII